MYYTFIYLLIFMFGYTALSKILNYDSFLLKLIQSPIVPNKLAFFFSYCIPILEILCIALLIFKTEVGLYMSFSLLFSFTLYLILVNKLTNYSGCSCGGIITNLSFKAHMLFNISFLGINTISLFISNYKNA
ncbi:MULTISPECIES: MauE/DoxX family redox-associated membrane protein [Chitinophagaceae]